MAEIEELRANNEPVDVTLLARRRYTRLHDTTRTERVNRRNERLNEMAQELGFDNLSQFLTAWKNGEIALQVRKTNPD
jgi:AraC-like DNA-binding protein